MNHAGPGSPLAMRSMRLCSHTHASAMSATTHATRRGTELEVTRSATKAAATPNSTPQPTPMCVCCMSLLLAREAKLAEEGELDGESTEEEGEAAPGDSGCTGLTITMMTVGGRSDGGTAVRT